MRLASLLVVAMFVATSLFVVQPAAAQGEPLVLRVGDLGEMLSRNPLHTYLHWFGEADDWGAGVLQPVYSHPILHDPATDVLVPYLAKGIDADGNGVFDPDEYGVFSKETGSNASDLAVYFDLNGVRWHDGTPMTPMDVLFSFQLESLRPDFEAYLRPLMDRGGGLGSNFTSDRWLAISVTSKSWAGEAALLGDPALRVALRFRLQAPYAPFFEITLGDLWLLPRHIWEGTGGGRHPDFGRAVYPEGDSKAGQGIPVDETRYKPFDLAAAKAWLPTDADVIGSGPFRFVSWIQGNRTRLERNPSYFVGADPDDPATVYDARLGAYLHRPFVDAIEFIPYRTQLERIVALEAGEIDLIRGSFPPEWIARLQLDPDPWRLWPVAEPGFTYLVYNMRHAWFGYNDTQGGDAADSGRALRMALAHLIDRETILRSLLQGYGAAMDSIVSPANTVWHKTRRCRSSHTIPPRPHGSSTRPDGRTRPARVRGTGRAAEASPASGRDSSKSSP